MGPSGARLCTDMGEKCVFTTDRKQHGHHVFPYEGWGSFCERGARHGGKAGCEWFRNVFRGGLVFKAHRLLHHSTLGLRVIQKKKKGRLRLLLKLRWRAGRGGRAGNRGETAAEHSSVTPVGAIRVPPTLTVGPNGPFSDLRFTLPDPRIPRDCPSIRLIYTRC